MNTTPRHPAWLSDGDLLASCQRHAARRSGPGGQHRNKVQTAVRLVHQPTGIEAQASERRSAAENQRVALGRLRVNLALEVRGAFNLARGPGERWRQRVDAAGLIRVSPRHRDFPAMLSEALDALAACGWDVRSAATALGCTASQLVKFLSTEPRALALLNAQRAAQGLRAYRGP